jgi:hypothetical protein
MGQKFRKNILSNHLDMHGKVFTKHNEVEGEVLSARKRIVGKSDTDKFKQTTKIKKLQTYKKPENRNTMKEESKVD